MQELKKSDDARQTKLYQRFGNLPVPEDLVDFYQHLDPADLVDFVQVESEYVNVIQARGCSLAGLSGGSEAVCTRWKPI